MVGTGDRRQREHDLIRAAEPPGVGRRVPGTVVPGTVIPGTVNHVGKPEILDHRAAREPGISQRPTRVRTVDPAWLERRMAPRCRRGYIVTTARTTSQRVIASKPSLIRSRVRRIDISSSSFSRPSR